MEKAVEVATIKISEEEVLMNKLRECGQIMNMGKKKRRKRKMVAKRKMEDKPLICRQVQVNGRLINTVLLL